MDARSGYGSLAVRGSHDDLSALMPATVALWRRFWEVRDVDSRNELIVIYEPLVRKTVAKLPINIRAVADLDDLYSFGIFGLIDAIGKCNETRDLSRFPAYACYRIRGAIIDELRRLDWVPRSIRRQVTAYRNSEDALASELGRTPQHAEVIASLNLERRTGYHRLLDVVLAQSSDWRPPGELLHLADSLMNEPTTASERGDPADYVVRSEQHERLLEAIERLTERQRLVIRLRFGAGDTQQEIAKRLGVTTARVCQIEASAIHSLRRILRAVAPRR